MKRKILTLWLAISLGAFPVCTYGAEPSDSSVQEENISSSQIDGEIEMKDAAEIDAAGITAAESDVGSTSLTLENGLQMDNIQMGTMSPTDAIQNAMQSFGITGDNPMSDVFSATMSAMNMSDTLNMSDSLKEMMGISQFDLSFNLSEKFKGEGYDAGMIDMQYALAMDDLSSNYESMDLSGKSIDCNTLFNNTYGDVAKGLKLEEYKIPKSFNASSMIKSASKSIDKAYGKAINQDGFKSVKNQISIGSVFSAAAQGLGRPSGMKSVSDVGVSSKDLRLSMGQEYVGNKTIASQIPAIAYQRESENVMLKAALNRAYQDLSDLKGSEAGKAIADAHHRLTERSDPSDTTSAGIDSRHNTKLDANGMEIIN